MRSTIIPSFQGITRCIGSANERLCWNVMWLLIYWAHTQNDPCESLLLLVKQTCQKFTHNSVISPLAQWLKSDWQRNHKYNSSDLLQGSVYYIYICVYIPYTSSVIGRIYNGSVIQYWRSCTPSRSIGECTVPDLNAILCFLWFTNCVLLFDNNLILGCLWHCVFV